MNCEQPFQQRILKLEGTEKGELYLMTRYAASKPEALRQKNSCWMPLERLSWIGGFSKTGANSVLVAPITIGSNVTIGAGSTISKDIPDNSLVVERSKTIIRSKSD